MFRFLATTNQLASPAGIDLTRSLITLTRGASEDAFWRVNYGTCEINQRGGDFIVDVDAPDGSVLRVLRGQ
ncbi:MAG: hypothetical protein U0841_16660 [Chloroflexia bacterium]